MAKSRANTEPTTTAANTGAANPTTSAAASNEATNTQTNAETVTTTAPATPAKVDLALTIERILKSPLIWPAFGPHEALYDGKARVRILRAKLSKATGGSDMIWIEGVVVSSLKLDVPAVKYPEDNPEGWAAKGYSEQLDAAGEYPPLLDAKGAPSGYADVAGHRFVYGGTLTEGTAAEMLVNNLRFLGWKPERVNKAKGLTGNDLEDFTPTQGAEAVAAEDLGMTGDFIAIFTYKPPTDNFPGKIQLGSFKLVDVSVTKAEATSLTGKFKGLLDQSLKGRVDSRRDQERGRGGMGGGRPASGTAPSGANSAPTSGRAAPPTCGKPAPDGGEPCILEPNHAGKCKGIPF
jgi:hypothetical protein